MNDGHGLCVNGVHASYQNPIEPSATSRRTCYHYPVRVLLHTYSVYSVLRTVPPVGCRRHESGAPKFTGVKMIKSQFARYTSNKPPPTRIFPTSRISCSGATLPKILVLECHRGVRSSSNTPPGISLLQAGKKTWAGGRGYSNLETRSPRP